jgi:drug/metabolite transporter (DMT)-like permease
MFASSLAITLHNKIVVSQLKFAFPWSLTCLHSLFAWFGCNLMQKYGLFTRKHTEWRDESTLMGLSTLFMLNIAMSNVTMDMVSLPMHQILRATGPVITLGLEWMAGRKVEGNWSLVPVVVGAVMTALGDLQFTRWGVFWTMLGVVVACTKSVFTNHLLQGPKKLHAMDLLMRMSLYSAMQCACIAFVTKEIPVGLQQYYIAHGWDKAENQASYHHFLQHMFINALLALLINVVSFFAASHLRSLTISVTSNLKQVLVVLLSVYMFGYQVNIVNAVGVVLAVMGGVWYAQSSENSSLKKTQ